MQIIKSPEKQLRGTSGSNQRMSCKAQERDVRQEAPTSEMCYRVWWPDN